MASSDSVYGSELQIAFVPVHLNCPKITVKKYHCFHRIKDQECCCRFPVNAEEGDGILIEELLNLSINRGCGFYTLHFR